jgi:hypothetical protein
VLLPSDMKDEVGTEDFELQVELLRRSLGY